jgi:phosphatidate cytidylyltransferase
MNKRYLGALILSPLIIFILVGGAFLRYGIMILSLLGLFELFKVSRKKSIKPLSLLAYIACIFYYIALDSKYVSNNLYYKNLFAIMILSILALMCFAIINTKYNYVDVAITVLGFIYIPVFLGSIVLLNEKKYGNYLVWLIFISSWLCDTGAWYFGRHFGKHKLAPKVSPNKTLEGSIGGLISSCLACGVFGIVVNNFNVNIGIIHFFIIGLFCGVFCQFGDLMASSVKRYTGVKDFSNLIPGHGGILDRFDSIIFAGVVVYYYIVIILGM